MVEWRALLDKCKEGCDKEHVEDLLKLVCGESLEYCWRPKRRVTREEKYGWIQKIIESGVPDGRARLILYVISRYLINVLNLSQEEAQREIEAFLENSCNKQGKCGGIYKSWIRSVLRGVAKGGWKPWTLDKIRREDPQLYEVIEAILKG